MPSILILGGTTEASALAAVLADRGIAAVLSYAGRIAHPKPQPVPVRIGGFGGIDGLATYLRETGITHLVDATHPFAAQMSRHALAAAAQTGVKYIALTRPAWSPEDGDDWHRVGDIDAAVAALAGPSRRVMLALGRLHVEAFAAQPQHRYLLRFVDRADRAIGLPDHHLVIDRGPFTVERDLTLLREHAIDLVVCKNAGGAGAMAKLIAARTLGLPVVMIDRPAIPARTEVYDVAGVLRWLGHDADLGV
ncbi:MULTISPECIES: cobalt-precorrin-6A reductase [unclassified Sphingomonas]|uniref:cobalt-precorrin-6A reductase n=1 Tax=unclassified Sphingomonas TaxID=196159 RepID=UPI0006F67231|nr:MULTISPECIES: cobalt-precorrin-6A reductase [unclassified Sphingomonas]KQS51399.1 cobalt-precorrin-6X reductase [Sphingomonas sp. Leaf198]